MGINKEGNNFEIRKVPDVDLASLRGREQYFGVKLSIRLENRILTKSEEKTREKHLTKFF